MHVCVRKRSRVTKTSFSFKEKKKKVVILLDTSEGEKARESKRVQNLGSFEVGLTKAKSSRKKNREGVVGW